MRVTFLVFRGVDTLSARVRNWPPAGKGVRSLNTRKIFVRYAICLWFI